jgi:mannose-6-phosphate isomerase-like protein (cupin superfamily)
MKGIWVVLAGMALSGAGVAQNPASPNDPPLQTMPDVVNMSALAEQGKALLDKAKAGTGSAGITLANYNGHYTMLTARTKSGGAEMHGKFADFLIVVDGEGTELTGGTIVDRREKPNGEVGGTRLEGATAHALHKGDVIHIPAGTPHQAIEAPGQSITIYVIKVEAPGSRADAGSSDMGASAPTADELKKRISAEQAQLTALTEAESRKTSIGK